MKHLYTSSNYVDVSSNVDQACDWIEKLGINCSRTRAGKYKELFSILAKCQLSNDLESFYNHYTFEEFVNATHETGELIRTYEGLSNYCDPSLINRIKTSLKGHELYVLDNSDRSGRDFSFELAIASKFAKQGYIIDFGHDADLKVKINSENLYVECKRIKSIKKVRKRIKEGLNQLHKRYVKDEKPSHARGIRAISISKMLNQDLGLLVAADDKELGNKAYNYNERFIREYNKYWQENVDKRTLGVAVVLDTPGVLKNINQLTTCHEVTLNNSVPENSRDHSLLLDIATHVFAEKA